MARKSAGNLKKGNYFLYESQPFMVQTNVHSKSGKHGHAKSRIGCVGLYTKKKKSLTFTADTNVEIPMIEKRNGQLVDIMKHDNIMHVMDLETYETLEIDFPFEDDEVNMAKLEEIMQDESLMSETNIEFWTVIGRSFCTRIIPPK